MINDAVRSISGPHFFVKKVFKKFANQKFWSTFASPIERRGQAKFFKNNFFEIFEEKIWRLKNCSYLCSPASNERDWPSAEKAGFFSAKIEIEFIEKTVKKESTSKYREQRER
ncbi:MAG: hypothetical protein J5737_00560 [Bacteroidales bacterium]|nr:hypothetical protein [Bacteroidales bacterium]